MNTWSPTWAPTPSVSPPTYSSVFPKHPHPIPSHLSDFRIKQAPHPSQYFPLHLHHLSAIRLPIISISQSIQPVCRMNPPSPPGYLPPLSSFPIRTIPGVARMIHAADWLD